MEFEHCFCQYLKNNMADIRLIPLDHVTYMIDVLITDNGYIDINMIGYWWLSLPLISDLTFRKSSMHICVS